MLFVNKSGKLKENSVIIIVEEYVNVVAFAVADTRNFSLLCVLLKKKYRSKRIKK